ncbi:hypothetical protein IHQ71_26665 [Rhizobium sp. TH2]|uniref:hypothetical protein n=1 Tax=Rhizobium sp. TH2 TaxID=2775403 RepID=UPI0021572921|nr:hypothetical protein [Rhizobium sp. TH2]UVC08669.1 hypothetical protein IHQ71_26665 [Rhizobium sp. TH2]
MKEPSITDMKVWSDGIDMADPGEIAKLDKADFDLLMTVAALFVNGPNSPLTDIPKAHIAPAFHLMRKCGATVQSYATMCMVAWGIETNRSLIAQLRAYEKLR